MHHVLKLTCMLLGLMSCLPAPAQADVPARKSIPALIESGRRGSGIVINTPKYDQKAKVFFLCYLGYNVHQKDKLEEATRPLLPVCKELQSSGAELVAYLDFPPEQNSDKKNKSRRNTSREFRSLTFKKPIVNLYHAEARNTLFKKDARGMEYSYGTCELRAVDTHGTPLAYFNLDNGTIVMRDAQTGEKTNIGKEHYSNNKWLSAAILATYKDLVAQTSPEQAVQDEPGQKKKAEKKRKRKARQKES